AGQLLLDDLLRDPADRDSSLEIVPLSLIRDGTSTLTPNGEVSLRTGDELLLAGRPRGRALLSMTMTEATTAAYVIEGVRVPSSWVWRLVTRGPTGARAH